jgi:hypothetical protein
MPAVVVAMDMSRGEDPTVRNTELGHGRIDVTGIDPVVNLDSS